MISLIIPCFNEEKNIEKLFNKLDLLINEYPSEDIEIVIVNNGSTDNSETLIKQHNLYLKKINLLNIEKNIGYGDGINKGINYSTGEIICWFHADLQFDPFDAIKIYQKYKLDLYNQNIMIKGKRINRSLFDSFLLLACHYLPYYFLEKKLMILMHNLKCLIEVS